MDNAQALSLILAHGCREDDGTWVIPMCCYKLSIRADVVSPVGEWPPRYEVREVRATGALGVPCGCPTCAAPH